MYKRYYSARIRAVTTGVLALAWWGLLYPELCLTDGTYEKVVVVQEQEERADAAKGTGVRNDSDEENAAVNEGYEGNADILRAGPDEIVIKSRLLEWIAQKIK